MDAEIRWSGAQITGGRSYQEDVFAIRAIDLARGPVLAILADGMGGHAGGKMAAELAVSAFYKTVAEGAAPGSSLAARFEDALHWANDAIAAYVRKNPNQEGMGCTLVAAEIVANAVRWISVGDSPLYLLAATGAVKRLNADHSMASRLDAAARRGEISFREAANSTSRNALLSALTGEEISRVDFPPVAMPLNDRDWIVAASDGLDTLVQTQLSRIARTTGQAGDAPALCDALLTAVEAAGNPNQDNTTVIAMRTPAAGAVGNERETSLQTLLDEVVTRPVPARQ